MDRDRPSKSKQPIIALVDVDGFLNLLWDEPKHLEMRLARWEGIQFPVFPTALSLPLVRSLGTDIRFRPVWMTEWGDPAVVSWTEQAGVHPWPIAKYVTRRHLGSIKRHYPDLHAPLTASRSSRKLQSAMYYLRSRQDSSLVWIEDGFSSETRQWAAERTSTRLVDTTDPEILSFLQAEHQDPDAAAHQFIETYLVGPLIRKPAGSTV